METDKIVRTAVECAYDVQDVLGPGHSEHAYHNAMVTCLSESGVSTTTEATIPVIYRHKPVARLHPDLVLGLDDEQVIVELKVADEPEDYVDQLNRYLRTDGTIGTGLLICFGDDVTYEQVNYDR